MKEIIENLFIGNQSDYESLINKSDFFVVHACKEPYHRATLGYTGRGAPKNHPEYYFAYRGNRLICNLVDAHDYKYIPTIIIGEALKFIDLNLKKGNKVIVHCNQGMSRSAIIGMLYLKQIGNLGDDFETAEQEYIKIYPNYNPGNGTRTYAYLNWNKSLVN